MAVSAMMSGMFSELYSDTEMAGLFSDSAEIRAMLLVEGALAMAEGKLGIIPEVSAMAIHRAAREIQIDPTGLAAETGKDGVPVPALVKAFQAAMNAPDHAKYIHWGATSQDIMDTSLVLRLRRAIDILDARLEKIVKDLAGHAKAHRTTPMAARTRNQLATPTSLGARIVSWAAPFQRHRWRLDQIRPRLLCVSLSGASGNGTAFGGQMQEIAEGMAKELNLSSSHVPWHTGRDGLAEFAALLALIAGSASKMANDLVLSAQLGEGITAGPSGASSTMPHKSNPTLPEAVLSLSKHVTGLSQNMQLAMTHAQEREGSAWGLEWLSLPQMVVGTAAILRHIEILSANIDAQPDMLAAPFENTNGLMMAEAASFALADHMSLPEARAAVKAACQTALTKGIHLRDVLASETKAKIDWDAVFDARKALGEAPDIVDRFIEGLSS